MGLNDKDIGSFGKGISEFLLTTFYIRVKKQYDDKIPSDLKQKMKCMFDAIKDKTENIYVES